MAHQLRCGGGVAPDLNLPPPEGGEQAPPPAAEADRISSLPEEARLRILSFLPLKAAVKLGMVSDSWSRLVNTPQWPCDSILAIHIHPATQGPCGCLVPTHIRSDQIVPLLANELCRRGRGPGHRLLRFFLKVDDAQTRPDDFYSLLDYAADCDVEDFYVDAGRGPPEVSFNFQRASHHLLRLVLFGVDVNEAHHQPMSQVRSINTLEVITIENTSLGDLELKRVLLLCPRLRTFVLRNCRVLTCVDVTAASERLVRLTVVECPQVDKISVSAALGLHSFRYIGDLLRSVALPPTCFGDLRICFTKATLVDPIQYHNWLDALPNLSNLVNLTICSNALKIMSALSNRGNFQTQMAKLSNLQNLRELRLVLYRMDTVMLSHMYGFLRMCRCSRLRNLFLELPKARTDSFLDAVNGLLVKEPAMDGFESLVKVKINNFQWQCIEIELVHFLFRKARSLQKLTLVAPKGTNPQRDQSGNAIFPDLKLLCIEKAPANVEPPWHCIWISAPLPYRVRSPSGSNRVVATCGLHRPSTTALTLQALAKDHCLCLPSHSGVNDLSPSTAPSAPWCERGHNSSVATLPHHRYVGFVCPRLTRLSSSCLRFSSGLCYLWFLKGTRRGSFASGISRTLLSQSCTHTISVGHFASDEHQSGAAIRASYISFIVPSEHCFSHSVCLEQFCKGIFSFR